MSIFFSIVKNENGQIISSAAITTFLSPSLLLIELISANDIPPSITTTNLSLLNLIMSSFSSCNQLDLKQPNNDSSRRFFLGFYPDKIYTIVGTTSSIIGVYLSKGMPVCYMRDCAMFCWSFVIAFVLLLLPLS